MADAGPPAIRILGANDAAVWWELRYEALRAEPFAFGMSAEEHSRTTIAEAAENIERLLPHSFILGAYVAEELAAIARLGRETGGKEHHKAHLYGFYVQAGHRGKGLGYALLSALIALCQQDESLEQLLLSVGHTQAAAERLYRRLGFVPYGTEPRSLKVGSQYIDETQMILRLR